MFFVNVELEMDKLINMGIFVGGALAGSFVATNAEILKTNLALLFEPPKPEQDDEMMECGELEDIEDEEDE